MNEKHLNKHSLLLTWLFALHRVFYSLYIHPNVLTEQKFSHFFFSKVPIPFSQLPECCILSVLCVKPLGYET